MLSFRDIATSTDDADALQTSLWELQRRRQAKHHRQQRDSEAIFAEEDADTFSAVQELAYSREVLHAWTRQYPKLRDAVASLALASSSPREAPPSHGRTLGTEATAAPSSSGVFSVAGTVRRGYPPLWVIPANTIPTSYYYTTAVMEDSLPLSSASSSPQRPFLASTSVFQSDTKGATPFAASSQHYPMQTSRNGAVANNACWVVDYSHKECHVRVRREALQMPRVVAASASATPVSTALSNWTPPPSASSVSLSNVHPSFAITTQLQQQQRVLARWPQGKPASAKVTAVLRSIDIEARKREQWNEHVRRQQLPLGDNNGEKSHDATRVARDIPLSTSGPSYSVVHTGGMRGDGGSRRGSLPTLTEDASGRELYWPAFITNTRAIFTGAACLHDDFHGLGLLQLHERFDAVLALALASPLQLVVDVVYAIDETSEGLGLTIDPIVAAPESPTEMSATERQRAMDGDDGGSSAFRALFLATSLTTPRASTESTSAPSPQSPLTAEGKEAACPLLLPSSLPSVISDLNYAFQPIPPQHNATPAATNTHAADARRREAMTPVSPAELTQDTDEPAPTATLRRSTLSTAPLSAFSILAGPVSQSRSLVLLRPTPDIVCAARARALQDLEVRWQRLRQALINRLVAYDEEPPVPVALEEKVPSVCLPDADSYVSPFIDHRAMQDGGLPEEPAGTVMLSEEEIRRQTRLPELQGRRIKRLSSAQLRQARDNGYANGVAPVFVPSRSTSPQPAARGGGGVVADLCVTSSRVPPPLLTCPSARTRDHSWSSANSADDGTKPAAVKSMSLTSPVAQRLPARRRSSSSHDPSIGDVAARSDVDEAVPSTAAGARFLQAYTPRHLPSVQHAESIGSGKPAVLLSSRGSMEPTVTSIPERHRDEVSAPTKQPRKLADPLPAHVDLSNSTNDVNTSDLTVEGSRVLSAAVRAAAARQKAAEEAIRRLQKTLAVPRKALPNLTVVAPSPASPEASASPSLSRRDAKQHQEPKSMVVDITNTSAIATSTTLESTPPSSALAGALQASTGDLSPFSWDKVEASPAAASTGKAARASPCKATQNQSRSLRELSASSRSPSRVGGTGMDEFSSSLQFTPPSLHRTPRQRFNDRGELLIPSLSNTTTTTSPSAQPPVRDTAAAASVALVAAAGGVASPAASFSTPPPPAPPSHSGSPSPRDAVVQRKELAPKPLQVSCHADLLNAAAPAAAAAPRTYSTARQLLTPSYPATEISSADAASMYPRSTASRHEQRSNTQPSPLPEPFSRSTKTYRSTTYDTEPPPGREKGQLPVVPAPRPVERFSRSSSLDSTAIGSDVPQLRRTAAFPSPAAASLATANARELQRVPSVAPTPTSAEAPLKPLVNKAPREVLSVVDHTEAHIAAASTTPDAAIKLPTQATARPEALVRPSFSPAPSSTRSSSSLSFPREEQQQQQTLRPMPQPKPSGLQSPRSLAASAAAAALAKVMAEKAAAGAHAVMANRPVRDGSFFYNRGYPVVDVEAEGEEEGLKKTSEKNGDAQQDSPLPRKPSIERDTSVPALAKAPTTPRAGAAAAGGGAVPQPELLVGQHRQQRATGHDSVGDSGAALSSSVNREVELPNAPAHPALGPALDLRQMKKAHQKQEKIKPTPPALAMPHRPPHTAASPDSIRALDDAELVRLYELLYRHPTSDPAAAAAAEEQQHKAERKAKAKKSKAAAADAMKGGASQPFKSQLVDVPEKEAFVAQSAKDEPAELLGGRQHHAQSSRTQRSDEHNYVSPRRHRRRASRHSSTAASSTLRSRSEHHRHHKHKHRERAVATARSDARHGNENCSSRSNESVTQSVKPVTPPVVPSLRLHELQPMPLVVMDEQYTSPQMKDESQQPSHVPQRAMQRRVVSRLVSPTSSTSTSSPSPSPRPRGSISGSPHTSSRHSRPSATSQPSRRASSACNASPAPVASARALSSRTPSCSPAPRHLRRRHSAPRSPQPLQHTVLVRRVVRRRRSEVFVDEGGSLVYRAPVPLHGPWRARTPTPPRASSRARSAGRGRRKC